PGRAQAPVEPSVLRLRYARADALLQLGRRDEALAEFGAVAMLDRVGATDAAERVAEIESGD
ncbi:MAG: hypothetical protein ACJ73J_02240, partial [Actinomycetes bacterium]